MQPTAKSGFTLIEMSVVLVVIGLIVGGILTGQDLIHSAQLRKEINIISSYDAAAQTFRSKYNGLPGDLAKASDYFSSSIAGGDGTDLNGNGDGIINVSPINEWYASGYLMGHYGNPEPTRFFGALYAAGLIDFDYRPTEGSNIPGYGGPVYWPASAVHGRITVYTNAVAYTSNANPIYHTTPDGNSYFITGAAINYSDFDSVNNLTFTGGSTGGWTASDTFQLDQKLDDGLPLTGTVQITTSDGAWNNILFNGVPGYGCVTSGSAYNISNTLQQCAIRIKASF